MDEYVDHEGAYEDCQGSAVYDRSGRTKVGGPSAACTPLTRLVL